MHTSMRIEAATRDALAAIAADELGGASLDYALRVLIFEHRAVAAYARLMTDPVDYSAYLAENRALADSDLAEIPEW